MDIVLFKHGTDKENPSMLWRGNAELSELGILPYDRFLQAVAKLGLSVENYQFVETNYCGVVLESGKNRESGK